MMRYLLLLALSLISWQGFAQKVFKTDSSYVLIHWDDTETRIDFPTATTPKLMELESGAVAKEGFISDGKTKQSFTTKLGTTLVYQVQDSKGKAVGAIRLVGVEPNVRFTKEYIQAHRGKNEVAILEVFELANIILALHPDAEKDQNMFDTKSDYYQRVAKHFAPYRQHPAVDTIRKYMAEPKPMGNTGRFIFPMSAYKYYYAMKMNAAAYQFDKQGRIKHDGTVKEIGILWNELDPMKDVAVFEDFARKSGFRKFYQANKGYYDELLSTFHRLSPVDKMQAWLEKKFAMGYDSYNIYFSPLNKGAQAATQFEKDGFKQTYMFVCKSPVYPEYSEAMNELLSSWIVFTEIDHNYVNPVSTEQLKYIERVFSNREKWVNEAVEAAMAYPDPYTVFNEYMTFALYTLYAVDNYSEADVMKFLATYEPMMENVRGFKRFKDFNRALLDRYKSKPDASMKSLFQYMFYWALPINDK